MKLLSTTPASLSRTAKWGIALFLIAAIAVAAVFYVTRPVSADQYDDRIRALQADMSRYQAEADRLNAEASSLAVAVAQLNNEKNALQAQVNLSQAQYDKLVIEIAETERQIAENQDALGTTIADIYVDDEISPIEMLASSKNIGEFLNKQEYRSAVQDELSSTIKRVKDLKVQLTTQKTDVEKVLSEQKVARDALAAKEAEQATLLARTQNDEAVYQNMIKDSAAQIAEAKAIQAALRARINSTGGATLIAVGSVGGYQWNSNNCPMWGYLSTGGADGNGGDGYGYGCRQCASYAAWKMAKETGMYPRWGNATNFPSNARSAGYSTGGQARANSLGVMHAGKAGQPYGHVVWVETNPYVNSQGRTVIQVSQYNYDYGQGYGMYSLMEMSPSAFDEFIYVK